MRRIWRHDAESTFSQTRQRLGSTLAEQSRRIGLTNEDAEALEQIRDRTPAEPLSFEERVLTHLDEDFALLDRAAMLMQGMEVDLDAEIEGDVTL